jgi:HK97 family phage prohead protease
MKKTVSASMKEHKAMEYLLALKTITDQGSFMGYASVFGVIDSQRDEVQQGAFRDTLRARDLPVKLLWQHQMDAPIGIITALYEDARGLVIEGQLLLEVAQAREAYALLKAGAVTGLSIGYTPRRYTRDLQTGVRKLQAIDLVEVSLVTLPANASAQVTVVKQSYGDDAITLEETAQAIYAMKRAIAVLRG